MSEEKKSGYFSLSEAVDDFNTSFDTKEKAVSGLKLIGKGLFNVARYTVTTALPEFIAKKGDELSKRDDLTDEKREQAARVRDRAKDYINTK